MKFIRYKYPQMPSAGSLNRLFDLGMPTVERFGGLIDDLFGSEASLNQPAVDLSMKTITTSSHVWNYQA